MIKGKLNVIIDQAWGSSGKGKVSTYLADKYGIVNLSSANFPNAGHSAVFADGTKFVAKAIPTSLILKKVKGMGVVGYISPGSGFNPNQLIKEWYECGKPYIFIHSRCLIVTDKHAAREREGADSTKHIASTMQGSGAAFADKILRKPDVDMIGKMPMESMLKYMLYANLETAKYLQGNLEEAIEKIQVVDGMEFRNLTHNILDSGGTFLHEGSQGYALSIDHGSHYPSCTSRNCTLQAAIDYMAVPHQKVGDVYLNLRTYPIRVGNVVEADGTQTGYSGDFYSDCEELTWEDVAKRSGMPKEEAEKLAERERTTVTKRIRRVSTFSWIGLRDAVRTNGVTKISVNFVQYLDWNDNGIKGGKEALSRLSSKTRDFIQKVEDTANVPVVLIGTGALHDEIIDLD